MQPVEVMSEGMLARVLDRVTDLTADSDVAALSAAYQRHAPEMFRVLRRLGVPDAAVDDAVQDVFFVAWRRRDAFEGRSSQRTWLYGIARKVARDYRRKRERSAQETPELEHLASHTDPAAQREAAEAASLVDAALERMSDALREVFVLVEIEGLSAPEIAEIIGIPLNTVYSRTRLARQQFRALVTPMLQPRGQTP
jgi:RNA polymerase sigma-70 factor (ECF subfamily)